MEVNTVVYDNAVPKKIVDNIEKLILDVNKMSWRFHKKTVTTPPEDCVYDTPIFTHSICFNGKVSSKLFEVVAPLITFSGMPAKEISMVDANLMFNFDTPLGEHNPWRIDGDKGFYTILYYVNDSTGDTLIKDDGGETFRVSPKKGRFVVFDSSSEYYTTPPNIGNSIFVKMIIKLP